MPRRFKATPRKWARKGRFQPVEYTSSTQRCYLKVWGMLRGIGAHPTGTGPGATGPGYNYGATYLSLALPWIVQAANHPGPPPTPVTPYGPVPAPPPPPGFGNARAVAVWAGRLAKAGAKHRLTLRLGMGFNGGNAAATAALDQLLLAGSQYTSFNPNHPIAQQRQLIINLMKIELERWDCWAGPEHPRYGGGEGDEEQVESDEPTCRVVRTCEPPAYVPGYPQCHCVNPYPGGGPTLPRTPLTAGDVMPEPPSVRRPVFRKARRPRRPVYRRRGRGRGRRMVARRARYGQEASTGPALISLGVAAGLGWAVGRM
jgi:hypothetical protein